MHSKSEGVCKEVESKALHTLLVVSAAVAKLLDTERGARTSGFADSTARRAERRILE